MKKLIVFILVTLLCVSLVACANETKEENTSAAMNNSSFRWPNIGICSLLPKPAASEGEVNYDSSEGADIDMYNVSWDAFYQYVEACQEAGFTVNYYSYDNSYEAENADGYSLCLYYDDEEETMNISIYKPEEIDNIEEETDTPFEEVEIIEEETETTEEAEIIEEEVVEETEAPEGESNLVDGMRPEFKEAMDSYEDFMDEYVAFMKKYNENPSDLSLLMDYADFMSKYTDFVADFEKWEDEEMNTAETKYYIEVQSRVSKKLMDVLK